jgi:hypothetical protein
MIKLSILFNPTRNENESARRTLTFQLPKLQYNLVKEELALRFPDKKGNFDLQPCNAAGSSTAAIGIIIWTLVIVGTALWHPLKY